MKIVPVTSQTDGIRPATLEVVAGQEHEAEPLSQGLRVVISLVQAQNAVFFSVLPNRLVFHAAVGADSARLAALLEAHVEDLHQRIQGPTVLAAPGMVQEEPAGMSLIDSPLQGVMVLAERRHRESAYGLALTAHCRDIPTTRVVFASSIFRDLSRFLRDRSHVPGPCNLDARWQSFRFAGLVGRSRQMRNLFKTIGKLAASDVNVLILGESGTGKELVARAIHDLDLYAGQKFVAQNCAALPEALLESELFGHCKGAFTGANFEKRGLFEEAHGGTFFLDEIADMPIPLQIKMLRVLQEGEIRRLGETRTRSVTVRVIAATNKILANEVTHGRFREDLFYRLNVVKLELPPLRRRREDVPLLAGFFCDKISARLNRPTLRFTDEVLERFMEYDWPGNVRELENEVERLVALYGDEGEVQPYMLSERLRYGSSVDWSLEKLEEIHDLHRATEYLERALIARSLERHAWNKSRASGELGISRQGLIKKIKRLRLVRPGVAGRASAERDLAALGFQMELPLVFGEEESSEDEHMALSAD